MRTMKFFTVKKMVGWRWDRYISEVTRWMRLWMERRWTRSVYRPLE